MRFLYLDDSGKVHQNDAALAVTHAGFSIDEKNWHRFNGRIINAKARWYPHRGDPHDWEIKSGDLVKPRKWHQAKSRKFCSEIVDALTENDCKVYSATLRKADITDELDERKFVPLMIQQLAHIFYDELKTVDATGCIVCDWSTHELDHHVTGCVCSMVAARPWMRRRLRGGVTYGSSSAMPTLQTADIIASVFRRLSEGQAHVSEFADSLAALKFANPNPRPERQADSIMTLFEKKKAGRP